MIIYNKKWQVYLDIAATRFILDNSVQFGGFCEFGSRYGRHDRKICWLMAARAQHILLTRNYWYTIPRHSAKHAKKLDS